MVPDAPSDVAGRDLGLIPDEVSLIGGFLIGGLDLAAGMEGLDEEAGLEGPEEASGFDDFAFG